MSNVAPRISVWLTCCNHERYIGEAIQSVLDQTLRPFEILISDDCSTDGTQKILKSFEVNHPDLIKIYCQPVRLGITKNKNFVINKVQGDYITWLDGDDRFHQRKLEKEIELLQQHPEGEIVFSNVNRINAEGNYVGDWFNSSMAQKALELCQNKSDAHEKMYYPAICYVDNRFSHLRNELISKRVLETIGNYDENITLWQDWEYRLREFQQFKAIHCNETFSDYREHAGAASRSPTSIHFDDLRHIYNKHIKNIHNCKLQVHWLNALQNRRRDSNKSTMPKFPASIRLAAKGLHLVNRIRRGIR